MAEKIARRHALAALTAFGLSTSFFEAATPAIPDPKAMTIILPKELKWVRDPMLGAESVALYGDVNKDGIYGQLFKWLPHNMSRPHFHRNERYIWVVSGTWWCGAGRSFDPGATYPVPAGTFVHHIANQTHFDGAKNEACILLICGVGPAPVVDNELK